ncbi:MAG: hypothetical protein ACLUUO_20300 [Sellimonas intestinalis]
MKNGASRGAGVALLFREKSFASSVSEKWRYEPMKNNMTVRRGMTLKRKEALTGYLFILLPLISLMILMYYPILRSFFISFFDWNVLEDRKLHRNFENYLTLLVRRRCSGRLS